MQNKSKDPAEETGTYSVHFGPDDQDIIKLMGWDGLGPSPILTRALERTRDYRDLSNTYDLFLKGEKPFGELIRKLNNL